MAKPTGIRQRGSSWEAWVYDRRTRSKIRRTFASYDEAKTWRADATGAVRRGTLRPATRRTVRETWGEWLACARDGSIRTRGGDVFKPSTVRSYETSMERHVLPALGGARLAQVTRVDLQDFAGRLLADELDASTIRNALMPLRALYRRALSRGEVAVSPVAGLELPAVRGRRERTVETDEAALLVAAAPEQDRALWAAALYSGLRRGELMALRWEDVGGDVIRVRRSWDVREGAVAPKSRAGVRDVPLVARLRTILLEHRLRTGRAEGLVFGRDASTPFEPVSLGARADAAWKAHGLERVTLHECRHAFSTFVDAAGVWPTRADRYMGHADHSTPGRYRHQLAEHYAADAARLDEYLTGANRGASSPETASLSQN